MIARKKPVKPSRYKLRPGRLKGDKLTDLRDDCFRRDGNKCQVCHCLVFPELHHSNNNSAHMAHKQCKRMFGDNLNNVQTECGECHRKYHQNGPSREKIVPSKRIAEAA